MPAVEVTSGKFLMIREDPAGSGNYHIPVTKTPDGEFIIPIESSQGTEEKYIPKAVNFTNKWMLPLIEYRDGNGEVPIEKKVH
jgi:hypothetical protein